MKPRKVEGLKAGKPFKRNAARLLAARLEEMRSFAETALQPGATEPQHEMRIAAKRLRYALELTETCFEPAGGRARHAARDLQSILGDLRDAEAMLGRAAGIASLESLLRTRQELLFARFQEFWSEAATVDAFAALADAVD